MTIARFTAEENTVFQQVIFMYLVTALLSGIIGLGIGNGRLRAGDYPGFEVLTQPWQTDDLLMILQLSTIGVIGTLAFLMLINACPISEPATITPVEYTGLLTTMLGVVPVWGEVPNLHEAIGMALIVGSGIFTVLPGKPEGAENRRRIPLALDFRGNVQLRK